MRIDRKQRLSFRKYLCKRQEDIEPYLCSLKDYGQEMRDE